MDRPKIVRKTRWGATSAWGTAKGKLKNAGKTMAMTGIVSSKLDG